MLLSSCMVMAQGTASYPTQTPKITMAGHFNSTTVAAGTSTTAALAEKTWLGNTQNVLYTKLDTVTNSGVDSFTATLKGNYNSVYTWCNATSISGTNTSCVVKLWASGDNSSNTASTWVALYTATVTATNPVGYHLVNSGVKWPYSRFKWTFTGSGTHSTSWYGGVLIR